MERSRFWTKQVSFRSGPFAGRAEHLSENDTSFPITGRFAIPSTYGLPVPLAWSFHHSLVGGDAPGADDGGNGTLPDGLLLGPARGLDAPTFRRKCLIQYRPVPGIPTEMYGCPLGDLPYRRPGTPKLQPTPPLESVTLNGPRPKTFRQRQPMNGLITVCPRTNSPKVQPSCRRRLPCAGPSDRGPLT